jgi:Leucine-rich repeat (LRR) protein
MSNNPLGVPVIANVKQSIPEAFFQDFPGLRILGLSNTSLESLPWDSIRKHSIALEELDLSNNKFSNIQPNQLSVIRKLTRVKLNNNPIVTIAPNSLTGLYLENLDLSGLTASRVLQPGVFQGICLSPINQSNKALID